jgi:hypothetical protein
MWAEYVEVDYANTPNILQVKLRNTQGTPFAINIINQALADKERCKGFTYQFDPANNLYTFQNHIHKALDFLLGLNNCISQQTYYHAKVLFLYDGPSMVAKNP